MLGSTIGALLTCCQHSTGATIEHDVKSALVKRAKLCRRLRSQARLAATRTARVTLLYPTKCCPGVPLYVQFTPSVKQQAGRPKDAGGGYRNPCGSCARDEDGEAGGDTRPWTAAGQARERLSVVVTHVKQFEDHARAVAQRRRGRHRLPKLRGRG